MRGTTNDGRRRLRHAAGTPRGARSGAATALTLALASALVVGAAPGGAQRLPAVAAVPAGMPRGVPARMQAVAHADGHTVATTGGTAAAMARLPFFVGEELTYEVRVARLGTIGRVRMAVEGPEVVRGEEALVLRFDFRARVGPVRAEDRTASWVEPTRLAALRFQKRERHPLSRHDERVELYPAERRWEEQEGAAGTLATDAPLDELSYMYFLRTLALPADTAYQLDRHYEAARNPTRVRVVGRRTVTTSAGTFRTVQLEMRVRDPRRYRGEGVIRLDLTDDGCRVPVRLESTMPMFGATVMTLATQNHPTAHRLAHPE